MGNIINDIVEDIEIKPNKTKLIIKWIISIAGSLIIIAFTFGQFKSSFFNRMDTFETTLNQQTIAVNKLQTDINTGFEDVNKRIDKVYTDGFTLFKEYQDFNKKQLLLFLDYGQSNKDLLRRMLELNADEKSKDVEMKLEQAKNGVERTEGKIIVKQKLDVIDYLSLTHMIEVETGDTIFNLIGATKEYINNINKDKYEIGTIIENQKYSNLYDVSYRNK